MLKKFFCFASLLLAVEVLSCPITLHKALASTELLRPFTAMYQLNLKTDKVGKAIRQLEYLQNGTVKYSYQSTAEWLIFSDKRQEVSILSLQENKVSPVHYSFRRTGTGKNKKYEWIYDHENRMAKNILKTDDQAVSIPADIEDKLSYQLRLRLSLINNPQQKTFVFPVISTSGSIKEYRYQYAANEELQLPYGLVKTIKLKREVVDRQRITYVWFAPALNYLIVKITQFKKGKEQFDVQLTSLEFTERSL